MAEVTSEATINFDLSAFDNALDSASGSKSSSADLVRAIKRQNDLTEEQIRLMKGKSSGSYTNPETGATTNNKDIIDFLYRQKVNGGGGMSGGGGDRNGFFAKNSYEDWADVGKKAKESAESIKRMSGFALASVAAFGTAISAVAESTIGANSYDYENKKAGGLAQAYQSIGMGAGGLVGGLLGTMFGPGGMAAGAFLGGQFGDQIGSLFGKMTTVDTAANTQLRALSGLTGGQFTNYSGLKDILGSEQKAQDFLGVAKSVMANTSGMGGLTQQSGIEFSKIFTSQFKNTLNPGEQAATASSLSALINHSNLGKNSADTAKAVTKLAEIATSTGVMPGVIASTALAYQNATGSRDYNAALSFANLQATQGSTIAGISQSVEMSGAVDTAKQDAILKTLGLSRNDLISGNSAKISSMIGAPGEGLSDFNVKQALFENVAAYKPYYKSSRSGSNMSGGVPDSGFSNEAITTGTMTVSAGTIYLSGQIVTASAGATEGAMPAKNQPSNYESKAEIAKFGKVTPFAKAFAQGHPPPEADGHAGLYGNPSDMSALGARLGKKITH